MSELSTISSVTPTRAEKSRSHGLHPRVQGAQADFGSASH
jgi:hypothetical protein